MSQFNALGRIGRVFRLAGRRAQASQEKLAMLRVSVRNDVWHPLAAPYPG